MSCRPSLIYDGVCDLCTGAINFLYALDKGKSVEYVPFQQLNSSVRSKYLLNDELLQGRIYLILQNGSLARGPIAISEVCKLVSPFGFFCNLFKIRLAQLLYDWVATRRYMIFGRRAWCHTVGSKSCL